MCGICGAIGFSSREEGEAAVRRMLAAIVHRGPDEEGFLNATPVVLGSGAFTISGGLTANAGAAGAHLAVVAGGQIYVLAVLTLEGSASYPTLAITAAVSIPYFIWADESGVICVSTKNRTVVIPAAGRIPAPR